MINKKVKTSTKSQKLNQATTKTQTSSMQNKVIDTVQDMASQHLGKSFDQNGDGKFDKQDIISLALNYLKTKFLGGKK